MDENCVLTTFYFMCLASIPSIFRFSHFLNERRKMGGKWIEILSGKSWDSLEDDALLKVSL